MDCVFCKIVNGDIPSYKVYEDEEVLAFLDINPNTPGHTLIVPKKHTLDITSIDNDTLLKIVDVAKLLSKRYEEILKIDGFSLSQNNGICQEVKHFHMHLIPRYKKKINMSVEEVYKKITER